MLRKSISVFMSFSVIVFLLSFSVSADTTDQPILSILTRSPSFMFINITEYDHVTDTAISDGDNYNFPIINCNRIQIDNAGTLDGYFVSYSWIMVPICHNYNTSNGRYLSRPQLPTISGLSCTNLVGCYDATFSCVAVNVGTDIVAANYDYQSGMTAEATAAYTRSLCCTFSFIAEKNSLGTTSSILATLPSYFNPFHVNESTINGVTYPAYDCRWICSSVNCFVSSSPFYRTVQNGLGNIHNDLGSIYGLFGNVSNGSWNWQSIDRTDQDHPAITDNTGSWWEAMLGSIQAIADPVLQQVEYENKAEDVGAEDALDVAFDSVGSSFGSLGDLAGLGDLGSWDGDIFAADGEQSLFDWFSQNTKNSIDAVPAKKGNELDIIDFYHKKISDYNEEVNSDDSTSD